jgi:uncharacterized protein (TIGR03435 family)
MNLRPLGVTLAITAALAQSQTRPQFAVTSVRPNKTGCCLSGGIGNGTGGGRDVTLKFLIGFAYRLQQFQISGGPKWIDSQHFDIEGKSEDPRASNDQLRLMLQSLLEDRFKLKLHRETKQSSIYALVVAKGGPKIKLSADQISPDVDGPAPPGAGPNRGVVRIGVGNLVGNAATLSRLATTLSPRVDRLIVDRTNLPGRYDLRLQWAPDPAENLFEVPLAIFDMDGKTLTSDPTGPSIFAAIQEQLGLKLESAKGPLDVLVIDHAEQPSAN